MVQEVVHAQGQQHPIKLYLVVWGWLFVLSTCSYLVDYFGLQGYVRWFLILLFMIVKAGLIVAVFMHMAWERLALMYAILIPPGVVLVFVAILAFESDYTRFIRVTFFETEGVSAQTPPPRSQAPRSEREAPDLHTAKVGTLPEGNKAGLSSSATSAGETEKTTPSAGLASVAAAQKGMAPTGKSAESKFYTVQLGDTLR